MQLHRPATHIHDILGVNVKTDRTFTFAYKHLQGFYIHLSALTRVLHSLMQLHRPATHIHDIVGVNVKIDSTFTFAYRHL